MEFIVKDLSVHSKNCIGCGYHKKAVLISFSTPKDLRIHDIFLTNTQAQQLIIQLRKTLRNNEQDENIS
mgnify:CR=1 FL=1